MKAVKTKTPRSSKKKINTPEASSIEKQVKDVSDGFTPEGPRYVDNIMHLSKSDLLSLENAHLHIEKHLQAIGLKQYEITQLRVQYTEAIRQKEADIIALRSLCKGREEEYKLIQRQIESVYGIDLTKVTYDDKTGRIHNVG